MKFVVYFNGEYDEDENGIVHTVSSEFEDFDDACEAADRYERDTYMPATIVSQWD